MQLAVLLFAVACALPGKGCLKKAMPVMPNNLALAIAAILTGCYGNHICEEDWVGDEAKLVEKHFKFLESLYQVLGSKNFGKSFGSECFKQAFPAVNAMSRTAIVAKIMAITRWLRRKGYNMKTGERLTAAVKALIKLIAAESPATDLEMPAKGMPSEGSGSGSLPVRRRLTHKVSDESVYSVPGQGVPAAGRKLSCQPSEESDEGVLALYGQGRSKPAPLPTKDLEVISSDDDQAIAGLCEDITKKRPASSQKGSVKKKPAAQAEPEKAVEPEVAEEAEKALPKEGTQPEEGLPAEGRVLKRPALQLLESQGSWRESASFGFVMMTKASQKSYIRAKASVHSKPYCLVNVTAGSCADHKALITTLFEFAQGANLTKEIVVAERNGLIAMHG